MNKKDSVLLEVKNSFDIKNSQKKKSVHFHPTDTFPLSNESSSSVAPSAIEWQQVVTSMQQTINDLLGHNQKLANQVKDLKTVQPVKNKTENKLVT